jgi:hypothetical protein
MLPLSHHRQNVHITVEKRREEKRRYAPDTVTPIWDVQRMCAGRHTRVDKEGDALAGPAGGQHHLHDMIHSHRDIGDLPEAESRRLLSQVCSPRLSTCPGRPRRPNCNLIKAARAAVATYVEKS